MQSFNYFSSHHHIHFTHFFRTANIRRYQIFQTKLFSKKFETVILPFSILFHICRQYPNRQFLDFEQPIKELYEQIEENKKLAEKNPKVNYKAIIQQLEQSILEKRKEITEHLTPWQRVQLSRHPDRPYTLKYIDKITTNFVELHGDRNVKDDKAMVGGFAELDGQTVMIIGQQKGINTKMRQLTQFWNGKS